MPDCDCDEAARIRAAWLRRGDRCGPLFLHLYDGRVLDLSGLTLEAIVVRLHREQITPWDIRAAHDRRPA